MNNKKIKYLGFYDVEGSNSDRVSNIAAINKMNYISDALIEAGYQVQILSPSWMGEKTKVNFERKKVIKVNEDKSIMFCPSWKTKNKITRNIKISLSIIWLFLHLIFSTKKNEKVLMYHVPWLSIPVRGAKFFKKFKLILELEEVYQDVGTIKESFKIWENKLIESADAFLYSTDLLESRIQSKKPNVIIYGEYKIYERLAQPTKDGKIHLVYAGIIDEHKKGAFNALEASRYLDDKYRLHILGFGQIDKLKGKIAEYNKTNQCKVSYDGLKKGNEYIEYCQQFQVGLSTQSMEGVYLHSSFPSKILSYFALGLKVISGDIECVVKSKIGNLVIYYDEDTPKAIATAVKSIDFNEEYDGIDTLKKLHSDFKNDIDYLIKNL